MAFTEFYDVNKIPKYGFFIFPRFLDNTSLVYKPKYYFITYIYLLKNASFKPNIVNNILLNVGELILNKNDLLNYLNTGLKKQKYKEHNIKRILFFLKQKKYITTKTINNFLIIKINDYELIQNPRFYFYKNKQISNKLKNFTVSQPSYSDTGRCQDPDNDQSYIPDKNHENFKISRQTFRVPDKKRFSTLAFETIEEKPHLTETRLDREKSTVRNTKNFSIYYGMCTPLCTPPYPQKVQFESGKFGMSGFDVYPLVYPLLRIHTSFSLCVKENKYNTSIYNKLSNIYILAAFFLMAYSLRYKLLFSKTPDAKLNFKPPPALSEPRADSEVSEVYKKILQETELHNTKISTFRGIDEKDVPAHLLTKFKKFCTKEKFELALKNYIRVRFPNWQPTEQDFRNYQMRRLCFSAEEWKDALSKCFLIRQHHVEYWDRMTPSHFFSDAFIIRRCIEDVELNRRRSPSLDTDPYLKAKKTRLFRG